MAAVVVFAAFSAAADGPSVTLRASDLKADAAVLRDALETVHPGLYRYNTKEQMAAHFGALDAAFDHDQSIGDAFVALSRLTATIKCGHTFPNPHNQSKAVAAALFSGANKVPFCFRWIDGRMIVTRDLTRGGSLKPGDEVMAINGVPAGEVLARLMSITRADGSNDAKRITQLEVTGQEPYEAFDIYFPLMYPLTAGEFEIRVRPIGAAQDTIVMAAAITGEARLAADEDKAPEGGDAPLWRLEYRADGIACLPMASWVAYKTTWDWVKFINDSFDEMVAKTVSTLVIDLRGNEGGSGVGDVIVARLIDAPVARSGMQRFVRYIKTPGRLNAVLDTWDASFKDWGVDALGPMDLGDRATGLAPDATDGFYRLRTEDGKDPEQVEQMILPRGPRFCGKVFVLVDSSNSSATFEFAQLVRRHRLATLVGQPTGGNQRGINGGAFFFVRLPRTGLEVDVPIMAQFPGRDGGMPADDAGIVPDVIVTPSVLDIANGVDAEWRSLIEKSGQGMGR